MIGYPLRTLERIFDRRADGAAVLLARTRIAAQHATEACRERVAAVARIDAVVRGAAPAAQGSVAELIAAAGHHRGLAAARDDALLALREAEERLATSRGAVERAAGGCRDAERDRLVLAAHRRAWAAQLARRAARADEAAADDRSAATWGARSR